MKKLLLTLIAFAFATSASAMGTAGYCQDGQCVIYKEIVTVPTKNASGSDSQIIFLDSSVNNKATGIRSYNGSVCTFEAIVPTPVFEAVMLRFEEQAKIDELTPALDPATQTMILFYNSFMAQAKDANTCS